ncbi:MAG: glycosyltransferase family A protein [Phycisphaerales bacterium]
MARNGTLMLLAILFWIIAATWLIVVVASAAGIALLPSLPALTTPVDRASVSVIIPVKDESASVQTTADRLRQQQDVDLETIFVNDRSSDGTGAILDRLSDNDANIRVIHIETLPDGWLGKCHALHVGTQQARGEWILFMDGDSWLSPGVIARAVQAAQREDADHLSLMPRQRQATLLGKVGMLILFMGIPDAMCKANRDKAGAGIGAFNLVRAEALASIGGHAALRMEVVDDYQMARVLYAAGKRSRGYFAGLDVQTDLARTAGGVVRAIEKNAFSLIRYNLWFVAAFAVGLPFLFAGAVAGPIVGGVSGLAAGVSLVCMAIPGSMLARRYEWPLLAGLLAPLGILMVAVGGANSVIKTIARGGVCWRGDFYRLADLRKHMVR